MRRTILILLLYLTFLFSQFAMGQAAQFYSQGQQTNAAANTILANTGSLSSGGIVGANYEVSIFLNGSSNMTFKLEVLNASNAIVQTIYLSAPANQATLIDPRANFFIPNGYSMRVRNDTGAILGATHQASIIIKVVELIDK